MTQLMRLRKRADFLRCAAVGRKSVTHAFILQSLPGYDPEASAIWLGFTATKKTGNAVIRNRLKRRLRALAREVIPSDGIAGTAYVLIARKNCVHYPYDRLKQDLHDALRHLSR